MSHANPFAQISQNPFEAQRGSTVFSGPFALERFRRNDELIARENQVQANIQARFGGGGEQRGGGNVLNDANARDQRILDETFGFRDQVLNDPAQQLALDRLSGVVSGEQTPFNQEVRSSILSGAADQAANSAANQQQQILQQAARAGMNPNDPAVQARLRAVTGQQGIAGQQALQNLNQQANVVNFGAQQQAANNLARNRLAQMNLGGQFGLAGVNLLANRFIGQEVSGPQQGFFPSSNATSNRGPTNVSSGASIASFNANVPRQGILDVGISDGRGGTRPRQSTARPGTRGVIEAGSGPGFASNTPSQQNVGDFNEFGNTAIPGGF